MNHDQPVIMQFSLAIAAINMILSALMIIGLPVIVTQRLAFDSETAHYEQLFFHDVSGNAVFDSDHVISADDRTGTPDRKSHILCHVYRYVCDTDRAGNLWRFI